MSPPDPIDVMALFPGEREALLRLLAALSDDEWRAPTICPGWSVKDIALHLVGDDIGLLSRGRDGFVAPWFAAVGNEPLPWDRLVDLIDAQNASWVHATRRISPRLLCELLAFTGEATLHHVATLDLAAIGGPVSWAGPDPAPVWLDIAQEYTERWVHHQQIRDAVHQPGLTERRWFAPVLDAFARALPSALRDADAPPGTRVRLVVTGEAGGAWSALRTPSTWLLGQDHDRADATVTMDQDLAWRLFTKGVSPDAAIHAVSFAGNRSLGDHILSMVSIIA